MIPMMVIEISCHHPFRLTSCSRRVVTARYGSPHNTKLPPLANRSMPFGERPIAIPATTSPRTTSASKSTNHQNSDRVARPWKVEYFRKHVEIDCAKVIWPPYVANWVEL